MRALWLLYVSRNQSFFTVLCGGLKLSLKVAFPRGLCPGPLEREWGARNWGTRAGTATPAVPGTSVTSLGSRHRFSCSSTAVIFHEGGRGRGGRFPLPLPSQKSNLRHQRMTRTKDFQSCPHRKGLQVLWLGREKGMSWLCFGPGASLGSKDEAVTWSSSGCRWPCHQYRVMAPWNPQKAK